MNYLGLIRKIKRLNETQPNFQTIKFFRSDKVSVWIWIEIWTWTWIRICFGLGLGFEFGFGMIRI